MLESKKNGLTLIEVLIMVTFLSVLFISITTVTTVSLRTSKVNEHKIIATHLSEELREWLRGEKEQDWETFISTRMGTWCFTTEPIEWDEASECVYDLKNLYKREAVLSLNVDETQVTTLITTSWNENGNAYSVPIKTVFSIYE